MESLGPLLLQLLKLLHLVASHPFLFDKYTIWRFAYIDIGYNSQLLRHKICHKCGLQHQIFAEQNWLTTVANPNPDRTDQNDHHHILISYHRLFHFKSVTMRSNVRSHKILIMICSFLRLKKFSNAIYWRHILQIFLDKASLDLFSYFNNWHYHRALKLCILTFLLPAGFSKARHPLALGSLQVSLDPLSLFVINNLFSGGINISFHCNTFV